VQKFSNIPALKFAVFFITGILIGSVYQFNKIILIVLILTVSIFILININKKNYDLYSSYAVILLIIFAGIFKSGIDFFTFSENSIAKYNGQSEPNDIILKGLVQDFPDIDTGRIKFILDCKQIIRKDTLNVEGLVLVTIKKNKYSNTDTIQPVLSPGNEVLMEGKIAEPSENRNPGEFNYKKYLFLQGIYKSFFVYGYDNIVVLSEDNAYSSITEFIQTAKNYSVNNIAKLNPGEGGAYLLGLTVGERDRITSEMKEYFVNAGVMHLIAVSGLNVAYVILSVMMVLSIFRVKQTSKIFISILLIIFYCLFTGSTASILRASIMGILLLLYTIIERKKEFYNVIGVSVLLILIYDSKQLFDPGFILSYTAVLSMIFIYERIDRIVIQRIKNGNSGWRKVISILIIILAASLSAQIGTIPLTAIYFEKISIISIFANVIAIPLSNISLALGFIQIIFSTFSTLFAAWIAETNNLLLLIQIEFIKWCASLDFAYISFFRFNLISAAGYYIIIILLVTTTNLKFIFYRMISIISIILIVILINTEVNKKLTITFLDVGQGDCSLIQTPEGKNILIDCGPVSRNFNSGERIIAPYLLRNGINKIDLLILSHLHLDHTGGFEKLLDKIKIDRIFEAGQKTINKESRIVDSLVTARKIIRDFIETGDLIELSGNLKIYCLFPYKQYLINQNSLVEDNNLNFSSLVFKLKYGNTDVLFTGDIEKGQEEMLVNNYGDFLKSNLLKVPHHGSKTSSTYPFILAVNPDYSVIFCGLYNQYRLPSTLIVNRLKIINSEIFRTDNDGGVIFESDGENINPIKWR
jgi:competence protein ComEC